jgi:hypothetical protein
MPIQNSILILNRKLPLLNTKNNITPKIKVNKTLDPFFYTEQYKKPLSDNWLSNPSDPMLAKRLYVFGVCEQCGKPVENRL